MPEEGLHWLSKKELMSLEEMTAICSLLTSMGIEKIRITGGEPFVRKDLMPFLEKLAQLKGLNELTMTTNGVLTAPHVAEMKNLGIRSVNLSLDTVDRNRFLAITHRDELPAVMKTMDQLLSHSIEVKINAVVIDGKNIEDILLLSDLTKNLPVSVRFIEEMPFNGQESHYQKLHWDHIRILDRVREKYSDIEKIPDPLFSTSCNYKIPGHAGTIGVIAAYSRTFCGTCNRIRITAQGILKTCLYDGGVLNIRDLVRQKLTDEELRLALLSALGQRNLDGFEAEKKRKAGNGVHESMATIGG
jgi:molybdenum cofactor biosynthesis enzyme MoaA